MFEQSVVGVYHSHTAAEAVIKEFDRIGFNMKNLSIVGKEYHSEERIVGYYNIGDRMKYWGGNGALWGGFWGLLFGSAFFWMPAIGPLLMAGPLVTSVVSGLESAVAAGGLSALGAGLYSFGIPKDTVLEYETAIKSDKFLVIAHGTPSELARAKSVLHSGGLVSAKPVINP
jgi:hypothetical protein